MALEADNSSARGTKTEHLWTGKSLRSDSGYVIGRARHVAKWYLQEADLPYQGSLVSSDDIL